MAPKNYTAEQIIGILREAEAEVRLSQGDKIGAICRGLSIPDARHESDAPLLAGPIMRSVRICASSLSSARL